MKLIYQKIIFINIIISVFRLILFSEPKISISKNHWNFGEVIEGTIATEKIIIKNIGDSLLKIKIKTSCDCISLNWYETKIEPNSEKELSINFDTKESEPQRTEYLFIDTNDPENSSFSWLIEGKIIKTIEKKPKIHSNDNGKTKYQANYTNEKTNQNNITIQIHLFYYPGCSYCISLKDKFIPKLSKDLSFNTELIEYNVAKTEDYRKLLYLEKKTGANIYKLPVIVIEENILSGKTQIEKELKKVLTDINNKILNTKFYIPKNILAKLKDSVPTKEQVFQKLKITPIILAGLIDGMNPCAFAVIVFLIAYLTMVNKKNITEVFWTGIMFIAGVFCLYFLVGIGLLEILNIFVGKSISKIIYFIMGIITLILSYYSFSDYFAIKSLQNGKNAKVVLQLPQSLRWKIYNIVEKLSKRKYIVIIGFFLGFIISLLEFFCTGQIYLPTLMYIIKTAKIQIKVLFYLFIYCLMFVLPLIVIFLSLLFGLRSETIEEYGRKHIRTVKLITGFVFVLLSVLMFTIVLYS